MAVFVRLIAIMNVRSILLCLVFVSVVSSVAGKDNVPAGVQFQQAYQLMQRADSSRNEGGHKAAMDLYRQALKEYIRLSRRYPDWQSGVTRFRMAYCQSQLQLLVNAAVKQARVGTPSIKGEVPLQPQGTDVAQRAQGADKAMPVVDQATLLIVNNRHDEARGMLLGALRGDPDNVRIRLLLGTVRCQQGKFLDALYILEPVVEEHPTLGDARVALATAYVGLGRMDRAIKQLELAALSKPVSAETHYNLVQLLIREKEPDLERAGQHYRLSVEAGGAVDLKLEQFFADSTKKTGVLSRLKFW